MKKNAFMSVALATLVFLFFGCEGPEGPAGPAGAQGSAGVQGVKGDKGKDASMDVQSSKWMKIPFDEVKNLYHHEMNGSVYTSSLYYYLTDKSMPLITQDIYDNGIFFIYIKYKDRVTNGVDYSLIEKIVEGKNFNHTGYYTLSGNNTGPAQDFVAYSFRLFSVDAGFWDPHVYYVTPWENQNGNYVSRDPNQVGKDEDFYIDLFKQYAPEVRFVTLKGNLGARYSYVDFSDYEMVKEVFGLKD